MKRAAILLALLAPPALAQQAPLDVVSHDSAARFDLKARLIQAGYEAIMAQMSADLATAQRKAEDAKGADAPLGK